MRTIRVKRSAEYMDYWNSLPRPKLVKQTGTEEKSKKPGIFVLGVQLLNDDENGQDGTPRGKFEIIAFAKTVTEACKFGDRFPKKLSERLTDVQIEMTQSPEVHDNHWVYKLTSSELFPLCTIVDFMSMESSGMAQHRHHGLVTDKTDPAPYVELYWQTIQADKGRYRK